jgi:hypothetical protein
MVPASMPRGDEEMAIEKKSREGLARLQENSQKKSGGPHLLFLRDSYSLMYFSGSPLKASRQPVQQT